MTAIPTIGGDLDLLDIPVNGVQEISKVLRLTPAATYRALENGYYRAVKRGRKWQSTRRELLGPPPVSAGTP